MGIILPMVLELFKTITKIPRCSKTHEPFITFIKNFASLNDFICEIDSHKNILCYKADGKRKISLQSHYDIVCLEENKIPTLIEENGVLKAKDSTLGADNGMGCAYMLALISEGEDAEYLFTSDEEIGLIGANNLELELKSKYMLNLDSEEEGEICIGCAGGIDFHLTTINNTIVPNNEHKTLYEITLDTKQGGHSGVDIDKNIPNGLKLIFQTIKECEGDLIDINGGERINSIPRNVKAIIASSILPVASDLNMTITPIDTQSEHYKQLDKNIIDALYNFSDGIQEFNKEHNVVETSINLATIKTNLDNVQIELSGRSMSNDKLETLKNETCSFFKNYGFEVETNGKYPSWKPETNEFTQIVQDVYNKSHTNVKVYAIHAGLECAIFKNKYPNMKIVSVGPTIKKPHSIHEECEIDSALRVFNVVKNIVEKMKEI
jgi:dipeptidase D